MNPNKEITIIKDEISLKDIIMIIQVWISLLWKNIILIVFIGSLGAFTGFYMAYSHKPIFNAQCRFIVKDGGPSGLASSLGSLGTLLGGSGGSSIDKVVAVISSEKVLRKVLLASATIGGKNDLVINHFIRLDYLNENQAGDRVLNYSNFTARDTIPELYNFSQRKSFKSVYSSLSGLIASSFDKKSGIVSIDVTHSNEDFAIEVNRLVFNELKSFFQDQATESSNLNVAILNKKLDSIQSELNGVRRQLARRTDQSMGIFLNEDKVELKSLAVKEQILLTMYGEAQKNLETFLFMGQSASSSTALNLLDVPYSPLTPTKKSKILFTLAGFFLASFFTFGFILIRRWYKNLMAS